MKYERNDYDQIRSSGEEYMDICIAEGSRLKMGKIPIISMESINSASHGLISRNTVRMAALRKFLCRISEVNANEQQQFYKARIKTINKVWNQLEDIYINSRYLTAISSKWPASQQRYRNQRVLGASLFDTRNTSFIKGLHGTTQELAINTVRVDMHCSVGIVNLTRSKMNDGWKFFWFDFFGGEEKEGSDGES
ncbi:hypothetical protein GQX74_009699 [Glossina fuscipes]|nr:hypothetical protein GQX74_009699 [Glossina fuscipes]